MHRQIAVIGAGIGGLAVAAFLASQGNSVTVYEKFVTPGAIGAGLLLQPTGLAVLRCLGLDQNVIAAGSRINQLYGRCAGRMHTTLDVRYRDVDPDIFGVGIHRGRLFDFLYSRAVAADAVIVLDTEITGCADNHVLRDAHGQHHGPFDLVIDASGMRSVLRRDCGVVVRDRPYSYAALWATMALPEQPFRLDTLEQRYHRASKMAGILPVGSLTSGQQHGAFFWSLRAADYAQWRARPLDEWKQDVIAIWPETEAILGQFCHHDDLVFANYRDVMLRRFYHNRMVFIGDAAHCTSPQLGQGANLALVDALMLSVALAATDDTDMALAAWQKQRRQHVYFYQWASRWLTPFFQSDSALWARLRFLTCDVMCHLPPARKIAAHVLTGTMTGPFGRLDPHQWSVGSSVP